MASFTDLLTLLYGELQKLSWRDYSEIFFFSTVIYYFLRWLSYDKQKNLVLTFYGYCGLMLGAWLCNLQTVSIALIAASPIVMICFIILHQQTLQKNFISLKNIMPHKIAAHNWLEEIMQISLMTINQNRDFMCVIEQSENLDQFLKTKRRFNADIRKETLEVLIKTIPTAEPIVLWITSTGRLITINPEWHVYIDETWIADDIRQLHTWKQDALVITEKTDSVAVALFSQTRLFDIIVQGKCIPQVSANHAFTLLQKLTAAKKEGTLNEYIDPKNPFKQDVT